MSMPPHLLHPDEEGCYQYYAALSAALDVPVFVQNFNPPLGTPMSPGLLGRMCRELDRVAYIKEETLPEPRQISRALAATGDSCRGVWGGQGGIYLPDEHRRGAAGNMPGCHATDALVAVWNRLEGGDGAAARRLHGQMLPLMVYERLYGVAVYKEVLHRRGVIATTMRRAPGEGLDARDRAELDGILAGVEPLFTV
jgi:4-hydroxy-tetrahydrodipicolinate synthase